MQRWTRREMLKGGAAAGAGALATKGVAGETLELEQSANDRAPQTRGNEAHVNVSEKQLRGNELRERQSLDFGWRFALGHACDPMRDFGFGKLADVGTY